MLHIRFLHYSQARQAWKDPATIRGAAIKDCSNGLHVHASRLRVARTSAPTGATVSLPTSSPAVKICRSCKCHEGLEARQSPFFTLQKATLIRLAWAWPDFRAFTAHNPGNLELGTARIICRYTFELAGSTSTVCRNRLRRANRFHRFSALQNECRFPLRP